MSIIPFKRIPIKRFYFVRKSIIKDISMAISYPISLNDD